MISLRYHIVTIVAVFLALALGLLGGSTFVQPALQRELERRTDEYRETIDSLREDIDELDAQTEAMAAFADGALPYLTRDRLVGTSVVVVATEGVEGTVLGETQRSLVDAGAEVVAVLTTRDTIASTEAETQAELAGALGEVPGTVIDQADVAEAMAERIAVGEVAPGAEEADILGALLSAGFVTTSDAGAIADLGGPEQVVVVLGGGTDEEPGLDPDAFGAGLVEGLVDRGVDVAAGEGTATPVTVSFVQAVRDRVGTAAVTVDDLDLSMGGAALILGIDVLQDTGEGGAYGLLDGAVPLPPLS